MSSVTAQPTAPKSIWIGRLYLVMALVGAILPWLAGLQFMRENGPSFDVALFVQMANANPAAAFLSRDLAIAATTLSIWMVVEARRLRLKGLFWVLLGCFALAFAFGCPLFLYLRERRLAELAREAQPAATATPTRIS